MPARVLIGAGDYKKTSYVLLTFPNDEILSSINIVSWPYKCSHITPFERERDSDSNDVPKSDDT